MKDIKNLKVFGLITSLHCETIVHLQKVTETFQYNKYTLPTVPHLVLGERRTNHLHHGQYHVQYHVGNPPASNRRRKE